MASFIMFKITENGRMALSCSNQLIIFHWYENPFYLPIRLKTQAKLDHLYWNQTTKNYSFRSIENKTFRTESVIQISKM